MFFRATSYQTVLAPPHSTLFISTCVLNLLLGIAAKLPKIPSFVLLFIAILFYSYQIQNILSGAGFISSFSYITIISSVIACISNIIMAAVFMLLNKRGDLIFLFIALSILVISIILANIIYKKIVQNRLNKLDLIDNESADLAEIFKNHKQFLNAATLGFMYAHPSCVNWDAVKAAVNTWPENVDIYAFYGKFAAIYPEDRYTIDSIQQKFRVLKLKGSLASQVVIQLLTIMKSRNNTITPELKRQIGNYTKKLNNAKRKLHVVWDFVLQANNSELDQAIDKAYLLVQKTDVDFASFISEYPNNKFVNRLYAKGVNEVKGDKKAYNTLVEKGKYLSRGITVTSDRAHNLGMAAFPNLPIRREYDASKDFAQMASESSISESELDEDVIVQQVESSTQLKTRIDVVRIPSLLKMRVATTVVATLFMLLPMLLMICLAGAFVTSVTEPIDYMSSVSHSRCINFQLAAFGTCLVLEGLDLLDDSLQPIVPHQPFMPGGYYYGDYAPSTMGDSRETREQLRHMLSSVPEAIEGSSRIRSFLPNNKDMDKVREQVFGKIINFSYAIAIDVNYYVMMSTQDVLMDSAVQASTLIDTVITRQSLNESAYLNLINNAMNMGKAMDTALTLFINYVSNNDIKTRFILNILMGIVSVIFVAIYGIMIPSLFKQRRSETIEIYKCLTTLPKATISAASEIQTVIQKDSKKESSTGSTINNETNKQEENVLKVFSNAGDGSGNNKIEIIELVLEVVIMIAGVVGFNMVCFEYSNISSTFVTVAPHVDYIYGAAGYIYGTFLALNGIILSNNGYPEVHPDVYYLLERVDGRLNTVKEYYQLMRYGKDGTQLPYVGINEALDVTNGLYHCDDKDKVPDNLTEFIACKDADFQIMMFAVMVNELEQSFRANLSNISNTDTREPNLWGVGGVVLYDTFFAPMFNTLLGDIKKQLNGTITPFLTGIIILSVLIIILQLFELLLISEQDKRLHFTLLLLLHCPPATVLSSSKVMSVLNGDLSYHNIGGNRNEEFFKQIVEALTDVIFVCDSEGIVQSTNNTFERTFGEPRDKIVGQHISSFFSSDRFTGDVDELFSKDLKSNIHITYNENSYFAAVVMPLKEHIIIRVEDETQRVNYNRLIAEERAKSDQMLSSILPPSLVKQVQAGEKNISFAVQSASVLFLDIVSFTPWCSSNTAAYVMKVLNRLFKELDALIASFPMMMKIKCIGDCYMAAGGIFSEVSVPMEHAKEAVQFGLGAIKVVEELDKELNGNLQIRVGVNTGGPLVAGVIGAGKPTFEILGPTINMAQQMEHHGVPMQVHISRAVYELIYGGSFKVKERGQIEVKNSTCFTYLVQGE